MDDFHEKSSPSRWIFERTFRYPFFVSGLLPKTQTRSILTYSHCRFFYTLFLMLTICGTLYIIYLEKYRARLAVLNFPQSPNFDVKSIESKFKETKFEKFMQCFSLSKNFEFLLAKDIKKTSIPTVHGIR